MENEIKLRLLTFSEHLGKRNEIISCFESQAKAFIRMGIAVEFKEGDDIISPEPWRVVPKKKEVVKEPIESEVVEPIKKIVKKKPKAKKK